MKNRKMKLRDDTAFLFLNILKRCKGDQTRFRIFTDEENTSKSKTV
jgi:hypothetical protein